MIQKNLKKHLFNQGASLIGFADISDIPNDQRRGYPRAISIAVAIDPMVIKDIHSGPTKRYYDEYKKVNSRLDNLTSMASAFIINHGYNTLMMSATQKNLDHETLSTSLPHKTIATQAGLGWIGRCALLVTQAYGSAIRLTSILTDAPFPCDEPINSSFCGDCTICRDVCPAQAVSGIIWEKDLERHAFYDAFACQQVARERALQIGINEVICGICIHHCPFTQQYIQRTL